jgi:hypothetical protein
VRRCWNRGLAGAAPTAGRPATPTARFGEPRLVDFLEREAASGHPPGETVRRQVQAVLTHQQGVLQDDATVLLARWDASAVAV